MHKNEQYLLKIKKSLIIINSIFPNEEWIYVEPFIYVAKSRMIEKSNELKKWERELSQARLLVNLSCVIFFLPEKKNDKKGKVYVDTIIDGEIVELKTVAGNRNTLGTAFEQGFKQGRALMKEFPEIQSHSVYIRLLSDHTIGSVKAKIAGELKNWHDNGFFICFFEKSSELHTWSYDELRMLINTDKKSPDSDKTEPGSAGRDSEVR